MSELPGFSVNLILLFIGLALSSVVSFRSSELMRVSAVIGIGLVIYAAGLYLLAGFPAAKPSTVEFSNSIRLLLLLGSIFICVLLGTIADYFFGLGDGAFSWRNLLTPLCVSPLVMLPLIGSLPNIDQITMLQWVSLAFLGFQNGFFWRRVFEKVTKN